MDGLTNKQTVCCFVGLVGGGMFADPLLGGVFGALSFVQGRLGWPLRHAGRQKRVFFLDPVGNTVVFGEEVSVEVFGSRREPRPLRGPKRPTLRQPLLQSYLSEGLGVSSLFCPCGRE
jgi:hypothetical protein